MKGYTKYEVKVTERIPEGKKPRIRSRTDDPLVKLARDEQRNIGHNLEHLRRLTQP